MTDNEIINALTHCTMIGCTKCPLDTVKELGTGNCLELMLKEALDLINRQKAEIERLTNELHRAKVEISKFFEQSDGYCNEAIDVFADSLKIKLNRTIDSLVKEMTEVQNEQ